MTNYRLGRLRNLWRLTFHPSPSWRSIPLWDRIRFVLDNPRFNPETYRDE